MFKNLKEKLKKWHKEYNKIKKYENIVFTTNRKLDELDYFKIKYVLFNSAIIEHRCLFYEEDYFISYEKVSYNKFLELAEKYL